MRRSSPLYTALRDLGRNRSRSLASLQPLRRVLESKLKGVVDRIELVNGVLYLHTPFGLGTSKLGEKFDRGIGVPNTARNWNTVLKLQELAKKVAG